MYARIPSDDELSRCDTLLTKTEAKLEARRNVILVEVTVVDKEIPVCVVAGSYCSAVIGSLLGDRVGKFAARGCGAVENVY